LLRKGTYGFKDLWKQLDLSATALTEIYYDSTESASEKSVDDLTEIYTGRTFEEFTTEYAAVVTSLQTALLLVVEMPQDVNPPAAASSTLRRRRVPVDNNVIEANFLNCFTQTQRGTTEEMAKNMAERRGLLLQIENVEKNPDYQRERRNFGERVKQRQQFEAKSLDELADAELRIIDEMYQIYDKKQKVKVLDQLIKEGKDRLELCGIWRRRLAGVITLIIIAGGVWSTYNYMRSSEKLRAHRAAREKLEAISEASGRDPFLLEFSENYYIPANEAKFVDADLHPTVVLNEYEAALDRLPFEINNEPDLFSPYKLERWGLVCFKSFDTQMREAARKTKEEVQRKDDEKNTWTNRLLGYLWSQSAENEAKNSQVVDAQFKTDVVESKQVADLWLKTEDGARLVASSFGGAADVYRARLYDFEWRVFVNGIVAYKGDVVKYRRHLSALTEMAVDILKTGPLATYRKDVKSAEENIWNTALQLVKRGATESFSYAAGWVQATGVLGADLSILNNLGAWQNSAMQVTRGSIPFVALQLQLIRTAGYTVFYLLSAIILLLYALVSLSLCLVFGDHEDEATQGWKRALAAAGVNIGYIFTEVSAFTLASFVTRICSLVNIVYVIFLVLKTIFPLLKAVNSIGSAAKFIFWTVPFAVPFKIIYASGSFLINLIPLKGSDRQAALAKEQAIALQQAERVALAARQRGELSSDEMRKRRQ
jgi:hypothetical protein